MFIMGYYISDRIKGILISLVFIPCTTLSDYFNVTLFKQILLFTPFLVL